MEVELGFLLDKDLAYYDKIITNNNCKYLGKNQMIDMYYSKENNFDNMTELQIKNACIRLRFGIHDGMLNYTGGFQNCKLDDKNDSKYNDELLSDIINDGFKLKFTMHKTDIHYRHNTINGDIQFQEVDGFGLMLFYYNPDYFNLDEETQRNKLIDDLNKFGFDFNYDSIGVDRLRSLYFGELKYSSNQNK
jgi:hypothetical protein